MNTKRHRHADLIHAWAEGAEIEYKGEYGWTEAGPFPSFHPDESYRIKPEKKPDVVRYTNARDMYASACGYANENGDDNLKLTFCGDTGKLIKAEVL